MPERKSVMFPGFSHQNPIPNASRVGNIVMSSVIGGSNPGTRELPPSLEEQVKNFFNYIRAAIEAAGGTPENIVKIDFYVQDPATQREALNAEWVKMFPNPDSRPARHTTALPAGSRAMVQAAFYAVL
jgi:2-iminobutanoate/2-iminopropanoate deaminase